MRRNSTEVHVRVGVPSRHGRRETGPGRTTKRRGILDESGPLTPWPVSETCTGSGRVWTTSPGRVLPPPTSRTRVEGRDVVSPPRQPVRRRHYRESLWCSRCKSLWCSRCESLWCSRCETGRPESESRGVEPDTLDVGRCGVGNELGRERDHGDGGRPRTFTVKIGTWMYGR